MFRKEISFALNMFSWRLWQLLQRSWKEVMTSKADGGFRQRSQAYSPVTWSLGSSRLDLSECWSPGLDDSDSPINQDCPLPIMVNFNDYRM